MLRRHFRALVDGGLSTEIGGGAVSIYIYACMRVGDCWYYYNLYELLDISDMTVSNNNSSIVRILVCGASAK